MAPSYLLSLHRGTSRFDQQRGDRAGALPREVAERHPRVALLADELRVLQHARRTRAVVYLVGRTHARLGKDPALRHLPRRFLLDLPFKVLTDFCAEDADVVFGIPEDALLEVGLPYRLH